jgi:hypothetical protein
MPNLTKSNPIAPTLDVPRAAPEPQFDLADPDLNFADVFPENFFSLEGLQTIVDEIGGPLVLTATACTVEYVFNPEKGENSGEWRPVLSFEETDTKLVLNKTRGRTVMQLARSPLVKNWGKIGRVAIRPAIRDGHAQIVIEPAPAEKEPARSDGEPVDVDTINQELGLAE